MDKQQRMENFRKMGYGWFIHYGLYSVLGKGEWSRKLHYASDTQSYDSLIEKFTARCFSGEAIAEFCAKHGFKYVVFTTRHHDGFSLYDTRGLNDFDIMHSPAKRDITAELATACRKHGILPIFYHTLLDWRDKRYASDFDAYLKYLQQSIEILCTHYGKIGGFWFDGDWDRPNCNWQYDKLYGIIRKHQPHAVITNNAGLHRLGDAGLGEIDCVTFERGKPTKTQLCGEMCQIVNTHWGHCKSDINYKSTATLIGELIECRLNGANYLLNLAPDGEGALPPMEQGIAQQLAKFVDLHRQPLFEGQPIELDGGNALIADDCMFFAARIEHVTADENVNTQLQAPKKHVYGGIKRAVKKLTIMDNGQGLDFEQKDGRLEFVIPHFVYGNDYAYRFIKAEFA